MGPDGVVGFCAATDFWAIEGSAATAPEGAAAAGASSAMDVFWGSMIGAVELNLLA